MTFGRRVGTGIAFASAVLMATPAAASALAVTTPVPVNLGAVPTGATSISKQLGNVTVMASGLVLPSFTATVSTTTFTTGFGTAAETIGMGSVSYWSGPVTMSAGLQTATPGQVDAAHAQDLSMTRTAFASTGLVLSITTTWDPTIVIAIPAAAVAGTYTGTITHSVA